MLVDDAGGGRESLAGFLEEAGLEVILAEGAEAAKVARRSGRAKAFFVSGSAAEETLEILDTLRAGGDLDPSAPIFYCAVPPFVASIYRALEKGAAYYFPFSWDPRGAREMLRGYGLAMPPPRPARAFTR
jgi:hypothetical protein